MTISCGTSFYWYFSTGHDKLTRQVYIQTLQIINMKSDKRRKIFISRNELKKLYLEQKFSLTEIGKLYKCSKGTIQFWLNKYKNKNKNFK